MRRLAIAGALFCLSSPALGAPAAEGPAPADLVVEAFPVIGAGSTGVTVGQGWTEIAVRIANKSGRAARGHVEVSLSRFGHGGSGQLFQATAPFSVGAAASVDVRVPALVASYGDVLVEVRGEDGASLHAQRIPTSTQGGITLLDVGEVSVLRGAVHEAALSPLSTTTTAGARTAPTLTVALSRVDPATGDPILPDRAALYSGADAVHLRSDTLTRLGSAELAALSGWVLAGGTLAVTVARPEDLRHPTLFAFAGGVVTRQGVSAATLKELLLPAPGGTVSPSAKIITSPRSPSGEIAESLSGYTGGNLRGSPYGASAAYGLGEVHLLAFDPTRKAAAADAWVHARVVDLVRRAYDRRTSLVFRAGQDQAATGSYQRIRQQLDPNESSRWAIGAAALLLCLYAIAAGPVNFALAQRAGRPLRALRHLPALSAIVFMIIVAVGVVAKGVHGRSRRLTLVEAGAGMSRATARRFRGFYAARAEDLTVRTTDGASVLSAAVLPDYADHKDHLVVDREGARLVAVAALPWQTVVVREDGFASLGDGVALAPDGEATVIVNRSGRDLRAAVLRAPDGKPYYFPRIKDGERVKTEPARALALTDGGPAWEGLLTSPVRAGSLPIHRLNAHALGAFLDEAAPGLAEAWQAIEEAQPATTDWFPDGVPALIAQIDGGEGRTSDAGLRLESDRLLLRVLGWGGRP
jgi:hypothetical protein